jgi:hypothetical protein
VAVAGVVAVLFPVATIAAMIGVVRVAVAVVVAVSLGAVTVAKMVASS